VSLVAYLNFIALILVGSKFLILGVLWLNIQEISSFESCHGFKVVEASDLNLLVRVFDR
jgi:hypothetical protein